MRWLVVVVFLGVGLLVFGQDKPSEKTADKEMLLWAERLVRVQEKSNEALLKTLKDAAVEKALKAGRWCMRKAAEKIKREDFDGAVELVMKALDWGIVAMEKVVSKRDAILSVLQQKVLEIQKIMHGIEMLSVKRDPTPHYKQEKERLDAELDRLALRVKHSKNKFEKELLLLLYAERLQRKKQLDVRYNQQTVQHKHLYGLINKKLQELLRKSILSLVRARVNLDRIGEVLGTYKEYRQVLSAAVSAKKTMGVIESILESIPRIPLASEQPNSPSDLVQQILEGLFPNKDQHVSGKDEDGQEQLQIDLKSIEEDIERRVERLRRCQQRHQEVSENGNGR